MRIGIVNDMFMAVEAMRRVVADASGHQVAWIARDGMQAVDMCSKDKPDLVLMDMMMPRMDGVEATRRIMAKSPCPILIVTASVDDNSSRVFEAMGAGALDAVNTPVLAERGNAGGAQALLAKIETIRRRVGGPASNKRKEIQEITQPRVFYDGNLVVIGASAGGPAAIAKILSGLPGDFPAGIVIVQHVDVQFADGLAVWLEEQTPLSVRIAREGDRPQAGLVLVAGRDSHLIFKNALQLGYTDEPRDSPFRPSINVFFNSAARFWQGKIAGVILTGMGSDGAEGLMGLRVRGHSTIAQDEATSAVYGMPKAAVETKAVSEIFPLDKIARRLTNIFKHQS
jgi:two-component system response regulator WspF